MRQAGALKGFKSLLAQLQNLAGAGQPIACRGEQVLLHGPSGLRFCQSNVHHNIRIRQAASSNCV